MQINNKEAFHEVLEEVKNNAPPGDAPQPPDSSSALGMCEYNYTDFEIMHSSRLDGTDPRYAFLHLAI